jgi:hypothetical protein
MKIAKSSTLRGICSIFLFYICLTLPSVVRASTQASTHWVSPTGAATWASCTGATSLAGAAACSLDTAFNSAVAGDTVYLRGGSGGSYNRGTKNAFTPSNSGNSTATMINYWAYNGEIPVISGTGTSATQNWVFTLTNIHYISIKGITFDLDGFPGAGPGVISYTAGSRDIEIGFCIFNSTTGARELFIGDGTSNNYATHWWIHDNQFNYSGKGNGGSWQSGCTDGGADSIRIGQPPGNGSDGTQNPNHTIENNYMSHAEHSHYDGYGSKIVIRNNVMHNEPWSAGCAQNTSLPYTYDDSSYNGKYGHRNMQITDDYSRLSTHYLLEGNRIGYGSVNQGNDGTENLDLAAPGNIVRYNFFYGGFGNSLMFKYDWNGVSGSSHGGTYNRVYNNTLYHNGFGYLLHAFTSIIDNGPWPVADFVTYVGTSGEGDVLKNNLLYGGEAFIHYGSDVMDRGAPSNGWSAIAHVSNNWCSGTQIGGSIGGDGTAGCSGSGNPLFKNPDITNVNSKTLPDLSLQAGSSAIDGGTWLTTATNAGSNSTNLTVADAVYFQDGTWGSELSWASTGLGGTLQADWIAIGTVTNTVKIASIAYGGADGNGKPLSAGTITLASPVSWSNGAHIWLYKKSDGTVVLNGAAPDYGASEYAGTQATVAPPTNLQVVVQ